MEKLCTVLKKKEENTTLCTNVERYLTFCFEVKSTCDNEKGDAYIVRNR